MNQLFRLGSGVGQAAVCRLPPVSLTLLPSEPLPVRAKSGKQICPFISLVLGLDLTSQPCPFRPQSITLFTASAAAWQGIHAACGTSRLTSVDLRQLWESHYSMTKFL